MRTPRKAACSRCGIRIPLDRWGTRLPTLGEPCPRPGCDGRIGVPAHLTGELDYLRTIWTQRGQSLENQAHNAERKSKRELAQYLRGFVRGQKLSSDELERALYGQVRHLNPIEPIAFPETATDTSNAELVTLAQHLYYTHGFHCLAPINGDKCKHCEVCRFEDLLFPNK